MEQSYGYLFLEVKVKILPRTWSSYAILLPAFHICKRHLLHEGKAFLGLYHLEKLLRGFDYYSRWGFTLLFSETKVLNLLRMPSKRRDGLRVFFHLLDYFPFFWLYLF